MAPWNYPVQLSLSPLVGAVAAGNCVVLKPSNDAPHTAQAMADLLRQCFDPGQVAVVLGGRAENQALLDLPFDHIFFTGGETVGRLVLEKAARHLTPVTLELGGKSPCIVAKDADLSLAARRIVFGKFLNAGQTCVAPDYLLVDRSVMQPLLDCLEQQIRQAFWEKTRSAAQNIPALSTTSILNGCGGFWNKGPSGWGAGGMPSSGASSPQCWWMSGRTIR